MERFTNWLSACGCVVLLMVASLTARGPSSAGERFCPDARVEPVLDFTFGAAEGVALSRRGDVFAGNINTGEVWWAPRGDFRRASVLVDLLPTEAPLNFLLGMEAANDGTLYVALNALVDPGLHGLWKIRLDGTAEMAAAFPSFFQSLINDVAIDRRGNIYVSDSLRGAIWRLGTDGRLDIWSDSDLLKGPIHPVFGIPFGVNGLAYHQGALYGAMYLDGRVVRVPIRHDGSAGNAEVIAADPDLIGADGIELDAAGNIYVAVNDADKLVRIRPRDLQIETIVSEGLSAPASLAVDPRRKIIYVANLGTSSPSPKPHAPALVRVTLCVGQ